MESRHSDCVLWIGRLGEVALHLYRETESLGKQGFQLLLASAKGCTRKIRRKGQLKEGMNGHTTGIDGGNTCRSQNLHSLGRPALEFLQEGCLSSTRLTCKKQIGTRLLYNVPGFQGLLVHFHLAVYF